MYLTFKSAIRGVYGDEGYARFEQLHKDHPDWTVQQLLDELKKELNK